jgi:hypothetical protein
MGRFSPPSGENALASLPLSCGVQELVRLTIEKQGRPSPTSPVKPSSPAGKPDG